MRPDSRPNIFARPARHAARPLALLVVAALALSGCGSSVGGVAVTPATSPAVPSTDISTPDISTPDISTPEVTTPEPTTPDATTPEPTSPRTTVTTSTRPSEPEAPPTLAFGQSFTWANGIKVTVAAPKKYTPKDRDTSRYGKQFVYFTVTLVNDSTQAYLADDLLFYASSGDRSTGRGFYDADLDTKPEIALIPGQQATWTYSFGVTTTETISATVALDQDSEQIAYDLTGTGKSAVQPGGSAALSRFIGVQKFGGSYLFATGIIVAVGPLKAYAPGEDARGEKSPRYLQTTITVTNGSRETISPVALDYGLAEKVVQRVPVRSKSQKIGVLPDGRYPPGSRYTVKVAFGVTATENLVLDVRLRESGQIVFTDVKVPRYSAQEPGAKPVTPPTSGGTTPGPVADEVAVKGSAQVVFGSPISWTNGVTALVGTPVTFTPANTNRQPQGARAVKYTVKITNGSREPITSFLLAGVVSGGFSCEPVVDSASGIGDSELSVEPGRSATLTLGCWAKDPADVVVQLRPDQPYDVAWAATTGPQKPRSVAASKEAESDSAKRTFGETFVYASGISVAVRTRSAVPVGAVAGDDTTYLAVEGTFTNNTATPFRLGGWSPRIFDGDAEAKAFYNERDFIGPVSGIYLLPGRSITLAQGAILKQPDRISVMSRDPSFEGPTITWSR